MSVPLKIFIIYAREDESFKISLLKAFKPLHRSGKIEIFHDGLIKPGERWEEAILENLRTAHIILPLVSTDFFDSEFIHEVEFKKAVDRYNKGETTIIPIILKHCGWRYDPVIPTLQVLPKDGKPVVTWAFHEEAWEQILDAVHEVTEEAEEKIRKEKEHKEAEIRQKKEEVEAEKRRESAERFYHLGLEAADFQEKIKFFSKALEIDPEYAEVYYSRGCTKYVADQYAEAIKDYDKAIQLDKEDADAYHERGAAKKALGQITEAMEDFSRAIWLHPNGPSSYLGRGSCKEILGFFKEAREDYHIALSLSPNYIFAKKSLENLEAKMK